MPCMTRIKDNNFQGVKHHSFHKMSIDWPKNSHYDTHIQPELGIYSKMVIKYIRTNKLFLQKNLRTSYLNKSMKYHKDIIVFEMLYRYNVSVCHNVETKVAMNIVFTFIIYSLWFIDLETALRLYKKMLSENLGSLLRTSIKDGISKYTAKIGKYSKLNREWKWWIS